MAIYLLIIIHTIAGSIAILSGFAALSSCKGTKSHRTVGNIFVLAILFLGLTGIYIALSRSIMLSFVNGIFLCYFVSTAWMAVRRKAGTIGKFEWFAFFVAITIAGMLVNFGTEASQSPEGKINGFGPQVFYFFAAVATVAALLDLKMIFNQGIREQHRIIRHLWRMCFPMFMATAAFFLGQAKLIPEPVRKIEYLALPVVIVLLSMLYWILRVLYSQTYKSTNSIAASKE
ncbi:DUF2306 domain-containing protein [Cognaticolwellia mytili]|uniref:DUF2306 domain-containing protein n=1 Tax=Cognaticolwellia mytili TaxID=1888913 RepID=UPI000A16E7E1|nr:DUF2306 domain-containing protein [Cognaticolwellia mytili]